MKIITVIRFVLQGGVPILAIMGVSPVTFVPSSKYTKSASRSTYVSASDSLSDNLSNSFGSLGSSVDLIALATGSTVCPLS